MLVAWVSVVFSFLASLDGVSLLNRVRFRQPLFIRVLAKGLALSLASAVSLVNPLLATSSFTPHRNRSTNSWIILLVLFSSLSAAIFCSAIAVYSLAGKQITPDTRREERPGRRRVASEIWPVHGDSTLIPGLPCIGVSAISAPRLAPVLPFLQLDM